MSAAIATTSTAADSPTPAAPAVARQAERRDTTIRVRSRRTPTARRATAGVLARPRSLRPHGPAS
jgi:hypothetical protein